MSGSQNLHFIKAHFLATLECASPLQVLDESSEVLVLGALLLQEAARVVRRLLQQLQIKRAHQARVSAPRAASQRASVEREGIMTERECLAGNADRNSSRSSVCQASGAPHCAAASCSRALVWSAVCWERNLLNSETRYNYT